MKKYALFGGRLSNCRDIAGKLHKYIYLGSIATSPSRRQGYVHKRQRLGGMINYYYCEAA